MVTYTDHCRWYRLRERKVFCFIIIFFLSLSVIHVVQWRKIKWNDKKQHGRFILDNTQKPYENIYPCLKKEFLLGIDKLQSNIDILRQSPYPHCSYLYKKFVIMYEIETTTAQQKMNPEFSKKMKEWLGNNETLLKLAELQKIYTVHDVLMQRTTVYNFLRSKRPVSKSQTSTFLYLKNITEHSKINCDFCKPSNFTAEDTFGRIEGKYSVSASNAFKLSKWHALFIPYEHSVFNIDIHIFLDLFNTSIKWFKKVQSVDENFKYPVLIWDMFPHAGASQMHVHAHGIIAEKHYPGHFLDILKGVHTFQQNTNLEYWGTLFEIHEALGLSITVGKTKIIAPLAPTRSSELWLLNNEPTEEYFTVLFGIIKMYQEKLKLYCFSMSGALPVLGEELSNSESSLPSIIFIGTRGECSSPVSDVSSLELYLFNNINVDPYTTIFELRQYLEDFLQNNNIGEEMELWKSSLTTPE